MGKPYTYRIVPWKIIITIKKRIYHGVEEAGESSDNRERHQDNAKTKGIVLSGQSFEWNYKIPLKLISLAFTAKN